MSDADEAGGADAPTERALREANQAFYLAFSHLDVERMAALWAHEGDIVCVHPGWPPITGWEAIEKSWRTIFENTSAMSFVLAGEKTSLDADGRRGHVQLIENIESRTPSGATRAAILARNSYVLREGRWLMTAHIALPAVGA